MVQKEKFTKKEEQKMSNDQNRKNNSMIRIILCIVVMIIMFLGIFNIIDRKITIPLSASMLIAISIWNGVVFYKSGRTRQAIFTFCTSAILSLMLIGYFITL